MVTMHLDCVLFAGDKRWELYSCDADIYDDKGKPVCSPVNKPGASFIFY